MHSFLCLLVYTTHQLQEKTLLDDLVAIDRWGNALYQSRVDVIGFDHRLELLELRLSQRTSKGLTIVFAIFFLATDVGTRLNNVSS